MLHRVLTVASSTLTEERILLLDRVEELRPMSHPAAGCAAILLEPETWRSYAHGADMSGDYRSLTMRSTFVLGRPKKRADSASWTSPMRS